VELVATQQEPLLSPGHSWLDFSWSHLRFHKQVCTYAGRFGFTLAWWFYTFVHTLRFPFFFARFRAFCSFLTLLFTSTEHVQPCFLQWRNFPMNFPMK
jgi:hypothetical protein